MTKKAMLATRTTACLKDGVYLAVGEYAGAEVRVPERFAQQARAENAGEHREVFDDGGSIHDQSFSADSQEDQSFHSAIGLGDINARAGDECPDNADVREAAARVDADAHEARSRSRSARGHAGDARRGCEGGRAPSARADARARAVR